MRFEFEWQEAPGVRDAVLAATWARLSLRAGDRTVSEAVDLRSESLRTGIYGSLFPLAAWLVENWWLVLHEPSPRTPMPGGRPAPAALRRWLQRHNLLAAREGGALPDLSISRDGDVIVLRWEPDPPAALPARLRFVGQGGAKVPATDFERTLTAFVEAIVLRLEEQLPGNEEVARLSDAWDAIGSADTAERALCESLGVLGVDPYDPEEATGPLIGAVERSLQNLPVDLHNDLLEGSDPGALPANLEWIERERRGLQSRIDGTSIPSIDPIAAGTAHEAGYLAARRVRCELMGIPSDEPLPDLQSVLVSRLGWTKACSRASSEAAELEGMVGLDLATSAPVLVTSGHRGPTAERFRLARAAFFPVTRNLGTSARLVTESGTAAQRASRAFAAELLAPASALARKVAGRLNDQELEDLADEFLVSPMVIRHQVENHGIGYVEP